MSPPPGNNGGAVSGDAPWLWADGAEIDKTNTTKTHWHVRHNLFRKSTFPPAKDSGSAGYTNPASPRRTGGDARFSAAERKAGGKQVGSDSLSQCCLRMTSGEKILTTSAARPMHGARNPRRAVPRLAQKASASTAWTCSNPDHDGLVGSKASNRSTASPALASSCCHNPTHIPQARLLRLPPGLVSQISLIQN